ncbi:XF1762 family protein [Nonomuraea fastidiosa]|uniref:XF1762 family protein n=1 Tax=Nonomuraea fastidiosa TaxID=46173 RepID=UPI003671971B
MTAPRPSSGLRIVPVTFRQACDFVRMWHRHHEPPQDYKFSIGVADAASVLRGVAIIGRPVARHLQNGFTLEVTRLATDGTFNAASMLARAAWRAARELGYTRVITYTQAGESGASLRGAQWRVVGERPAQPGWDRPSRPRADRGTERVARTLWEVTADA